MGVDFASVLTKNRGYIGTMRILANRLLAGLAVVAPATGRTRHFPP